jgi:hypothetical protein
MALNDALHNRQADAGSRKLPGLMETLESSEQLLRVSHVKSHPVIPDEENRLPLHFGAADFDKRVGPRW